MKKYLSILFLLCGQAMAGLSTINPAIPATNAPLQSAPMRVQFQAAYTDINSLIQQNQNHTAPSSPVLGQLWLDTNSTTYILKEWDGTSWVTRGTLNSVTHAWSNSGTFNGNTWAAGTGTLSIAAGKTFTSSNTITLAGTDSTVMTFPTTSANIARTDAAQTFNGAQNFASQPTIPGFSSSSTGSTLLSANSTQIELAVRNTNTGNASQARVDWGNNASANAGTIGLYGSNHATKPGRFEISNQANAPLVLQTNGTDVLSISGAGTSEFSGLIQGDLGMKVNGVLAVDNSSNTTNVTLAGRNTNGSTAAVNRLELGTNLSATSFTLDVYGSGHSTKPNYVEFGNQQNGPLSFLSNGTVNASLNAAGLFSVATSGASGGISIAPSTLGSKFLTLGGTPSDNASGIIQFIASNATTNWKCGTNITVSGAFQCIPSTAGGGTTFTTSIFDLSTVGLSLTGTLTASDVVTMNKTSGSSDNGTSGYAAYINTLTPSTTAALIRFAGAVSSDIYFGRKTNADSFVWGVVGSVPSMTMTPSTGALSVTGSFSATGHVISAGSVPTVANNDFGSTTQGTITASGNDNAFLLNIGTAAVTSCAVTFNTAWAAAPKACTFTPANTTAAAAATVAAYVSSITTTKLIISGAALASAAYYVHCF